MATTIDFPVVDRIKVYETTRQKGVEYLLDVIADDGEVDVQSPRVTYYRLPWALAGSGETAAAHRVLDWIERRGLSPVGAFHGGIPWSSEANRAFNTYPETCLAYGAHLLRRFDVAQRLMGFAARFQDPETGGIFMDRDRTDAGGPQLIFLTAQFGMSAVMTGRTDEAVAVGRWLQRLWEAQPELPHRLYSVWNRDGGLATVVPSGENVRQYVNESQEERQFHYNGGIAAACLMHLHMATGNDEWLELARSYQRFSMESTERQFETKQVCKSAWGGGLLVLATHDRGYVDWLLRMGDWFAAGQEADGGWSNTPYLDPDPTLAHRTELTAEFVVHLDTVIAALSVAAGRSAGT